MDIFQSLRDRGIISIEMMPNEYGGFHISNIYDEAISLTLPTDSIIGKTAFEQQSWDTDKINFFQTHSLKYEKVVLIDVGANVGLFSRQCIAALSNLETIFAYEPHRINYSILCRNLSNTKVHISLINAALSNHDGEVELYLDSRNCGNYSLNKGAMWDHPEYTTSTIKVIDASKEQIKWANHDAPIFYKSDTQGFDELIATTYDIDIWKKVQCASFELWRVDKPEFDKDKFVEMLNQFPNKGFQYGNRNSLTNNEILDYLSGRDGDHEDLLCWK